MLEHLQPSPIVPLNRAVAVAMVEGPRRPALALIDELAATAELGRYHLLCTPLERIHCGSWGCQRMLQPVTSAPLRSCNKSERRFLERRLREMQALGA